MPKLIKAKKEVAFQFPDGKELDTVADKMEDIFKRFSPAASIDVMDFRGDGEEYYVITLKTFKKTIPQNIAKQLSEQMRKYKLFLCGVEVRGREVDLYYTFSSV